jgi:hypothetical protein
MIPALWPGLSGLAKRSNSSASSLKRTALSSGGNHGAFSQRSLLRVVLPPAFSIRGSEKSSSSRAFSDVSCRIAYSRTVVPRLGEQNSAGTSKTL